MSALPTHIDSLTTNAGARPCGHRHSHRNPEHRHSLPRHYYNHSSSQSVSNSSLSNKSFNLENGGGQASPLPPPLPQRPQSLRLIHQQLTNRNEASADIPRVNRDSYSCWSDDSGSTRLPAFPEEDNDSYVSQLDLDNIRLQHYTNTKHTVVRNKSNQRKASSQQPLNNRLLSCATYQHRPPVVATAVVHPSQQTAAVATPTGVTVVSNVLTLSSDSSISPGGGYLSAGAVGNGGFVARGCGGRCETCENVCYYLLQVAFAMGVLIGTSLCIAGAALRRSPGRQLQVLLYIGALVALVSALLLIVQCRARKQANRYYQHHQQQIPATTPQTCHALPQQQSMHVVAMQHQQVPTVNNTIVNVNNKYGHVSRHQQQMAAAAAVTTMQRGVPVTVLQQVYYDQGQNSGVDSRNRETRILL